MSQEIVAKLAKIGIKAELHENGSVKVTLTQFGKAQDVLGDKAVKAGALIVKENRVIAKVDEDALDKAVAEKAKAPRSASNVVVTSRTVYTVQSDGENVVDFAEWNSDSGHGLIRVNGIEFPIGTGRAEEFYNMTAESDPNRVVYYVSVPVNGEYLQVTSYGVLNLIKRVCAMDEVIG